MFLSLEKHKRITSGKRSEVIKCLNDYRGFIRSVIAVRRSRVLDQGVVISQAMPSICSVRKSFKYI